MNQGRRLGLLGGTFDPIHCGHLDAADAAERVLSLDEIAFVPSSAPPHRTAGPHATPFHRSSLVALAMDGHPTWRVSDVELRREGRSYTADTLRTFHGLGWLPSQLFFILGADAFAEIAIWREFPAVLDLANFAVVARPGTTLALAAARTPALGSRLRVDAHAASNQAGTGIFLVEASTRDVSSTRIRERLATGASIADCVPEAVARYISAHHLYGAVDDLHGQEKHTR